MRGVEKGGLVEMGIKSEKIKVSRRQGRRHEETTHPPYCLVF